MHTAPRRHILAKSLGSANVADTGEYLSAPRTFVYVVPIEAQCYAVGLIFGNCFSKSMHIISASITPIRSDRAFAAGFNAGKHILIANDDFDQPTTQNPNATGAELVVPQAIAALRQAIGLI